MKFEHRFELKPHLWFICDRSISCMLKYREMFPDDNATVGHNHKPAINNEPPSSIVLFSNHTRG